MMEIKWLACVGVEVVNLNYLMFRRFGSFWSVISSSTPASPSSHRRFQRFPANSNFPDTTPVHHLPTRPSPLTIFDPRLRSRRRISRRTPIQAIGNVQERRPERGPRSRHLHPTSTCRQSLEWCGLGARARRLRRVSERAVVIIAEDESSAGTSSGDLASDTLRPPTAGVRSGTRPLHGNNTIPGELHLGGDGESFPVDDRPKKKKIGVAVAWEVRPCLFCCRWKCDIWRVVLVVGALSVLYETPGQNDAQELLADHREGDFLYLQGKTATISARFASITT
jgi:hypothetical protein